ncbi:MAG: alpha-E domain-containing protein [Nitriliruptorales bacterium]|nr:alpha-E domain-containing protein [Nitriliruptorales bacterium]
MLARLAENLFWAGRYAERADDTARLVDVTYHSLLGTADADEERSWEELLDVLHQTAAYAERDQAMVPQQVIRFLITDRDNPGSVVSSIGHARQNVRSVREHVSTEVWEAINAIELELQGRDIAADVDERPYELLSLVKQRSQTIAGAITETMPRDDGWRFLILGRMLERAEMTCRLLSVRLGQLLARSATPAFHDWLTVLKSASALEAYRKSYRTSMEPSHVVEFLLLSPEFPRSVFFALTSAEHQLVRLSPDSDQTWPRRRVGRLRSELEFSSVDELLAADLYEFLDHVTEGVHGVAEAVAATYFRHGPAGMLHLIEAS